MIYIVEYTEKPINPDGDFVDAKSVTEYQKGVDEILDWNLMEDDNYREKGFHMCNNGDIVINTKVFDMSREYETPHIEYLKKEIMKRYINNL